MPPYKPVVSRPAPGSADDDTGRQAAAQRDAMARRVWEGGDAELLAERAGGYVLILDRLCTCLTEGEVDALMRALAGHLGYEIHDPHE